MNWRRIFERINNWEQWPFYLRYLPIGPVWLWYCIRSGSLWFFTSSNPTITFGGFEGEAKNEMYELLPEGSFPKTIYINPAESIEKVKNKIEAANFSYPICAKPDVGMKGLLFRKISHEKDLQYYHSLIPVQYIIQDLVQSPLEVSVFYYRFPDQQKGVITGFIQKELMEITGDGKRTVLELIQQHPKAKFKEQEMRIKHAESLHLVLPLNKVYLLSYAANLNRGARFVNLDHLIDEQLHALFDELSHKGKFYYGRYDIKCDSIDDLKKRRNFTILEFNGSGAEPNHVYNRGFTLIQAHKVLLFHWKVLYQISRYNHPHGVRYWPFMKGLRFFRASKKHLSLLETYDTKILI